jgi:phosphoribosylglycinamide formyltransferase-1
MLSKIRIGVLISGGGSNLQAIIDACEKGILKDIAQVSLVISNKPDAYGLERAKKHNIEAVYIDNKKFPDNPAYCSRLVIEFMERNIDIVCLAGFLLKIEPNFIRAFSKNILNIHPALLPKFGGKGMYGHFVHEAVVEAKEKESGATVHFVDDEYDHGKTILQRKVQVLENDTPFSLAQKVLAVEHEIYPEAIKMVINMQEEK